MSHLSHLAAPGADDAALLVLDDMRPVDAQLRRAVVDLVRRAYGDGQSLSVSALLRICRQTAQTLKDPRDVTARAAALSTPSDGTMAPFATVPDPATARVHDVKRGRSKKGATALVTRRGPAVVIGSRDIAPDHRVSDDATTDDATRRRRAASNLLLAATRQHLVRDTGERWTLGLDGLDVTRVTDAVYGDVLPDPIGSHDLSFEQMIAADVTDRAPVAALRSGLDGTTSVSGINAYAAPVTVYAPHTEWTPALPSVRICPHSGVAHAGPRDALSELADRRDIWHNAQGVRVSTTSARRLPSHRVRTRLPMRLRQSEVSALAAHAWHELPALPRQPRQYVTSATMRADESEPIVWRVLTIAAPRTPGTRWHGHTRIGRDTTPDTTATRRKTAAVKRARNIRPDAVPAPTGRAAWTELLATIPPAGRLVVTLPDGERVTFTRGQGKHPKLNAAGALGRMQARRADAMAIKVDHALAALLAA